MASFTASVKTFFGLNPNYRNLGRLQTFSEFSAELKELSMPVKRELAEMLRATGMDVDDPTEPKPAA